MADGEMREIRSHDCMMVKAYFRAAIMEIWGKGKDDMMVFGVGGVLVQTGIIKDLYLNKMFSPIPVWNRRTP